MTLLPLERMQTATKALYLPVMGTFPFPWCPGGGLAFLTLWFESKPRTKAKEKSWSIEPALIFSFHCLFSLISISTSADVTATHQCTWSWGEREGEWPRAGVGIKLNLILRLLAGPVTTEQWQRSGTTGHTTEQGWRCSVCAGEQGHHQEGWSPSCHRPTSEENNSHSPYKHLSKTKRNL